MCLISETFEHIVRSGGPTDFVSFTCCTTAEKKQWKNPGVTTTEIYHITRKFIHNIIWQIKWKWVNVLNEFGRVRASFACVYFLLLRYRANFPRKLLLRFMVEDQSMIFFRLAHGKLLNETALFINYSIILTDFAELSLLWNQRDREVNIFNF